MIGTVIRYFPAKGYGFIDGGNDETIFFHISQAINRHFIFRSFDVVKFEMGISERTGNPEARKIELVERANTPGTPGTPSTPVTPPAAPAAENGEKAGA